jgi:hypothetical protein
MRNIPSRQKLEIVTRGVLNKVCKLEKLLGRPYGDQATYLSGCKY